MQRLLAFVSLWRRLVDKAPPPGLGELGTLGMPHTNGTSLPQQGHIGEDGAMHGREVHAAQVTQSLNGLVESGLFVVEEFGQ